MNIRDLEAFLAVVETGSIVAASGRLNLTQPGVTRRVQALEDALGAVLLDRQAKPLKPTRAGRDAYEMGRHVVGAVADLKARLAPTGVVEGEFRFGVTPFLSEMALAEPLDHLRAAFPRLMPRVSSDWSANLIEQLHSSVLDVACLSLPTHVAPPDALVAIPLGTLPVEVVASRHFTFPASTRLVDLSAYPWVLSQHGCDFRRILKRTFENARLPFEVAAEALSSELRLSLVARGVGIGFATQAMLAASRHRDELQSVALMDFSPQMDAWLVHAPQLRRLTPAVEHLAQHLSKAISTSLPRSRNTDAKDLVEDEYRLA
ncbi:LysR family transcriptional regulator [Roseixanthobacter pseudopolyaromaticivorans]|uniref:LysR family transcriptional regulator n=1 Tax=Xanthobacteraceae TaxID=335928 RepID=UPI00372B17E1